MAEIVSAADRERLREVAREQLRWAGSDHNQEVLRAWRRHGAFLPERPMIHLEIWGFEQALLAPRLRCQGQAARAIEAQMMRQYLNQALFGDDRPVPDAYPVRWRTWFVPFGLKPQCEAVQGAQNGLGERIHPILTDLEDDFDKLGKTVYGVDREGTLAELALADELIGDILPVRLGMDALYITPMQDVVKLMGMESMFCAMLDTPELFAAMLDRYVSGVLEYFRFLESEKLLLPTTGDQLLAQGSRCFTNELTQSPAATREVWGFLDAQETSSISPQLYEELVFPCYRRIAAEYGLLSYGCCEPVDRVWEHGVSSLGNLRKVSVSPWCDEAFMGERLRGKRIVYLRKPSPNLLMLGDTLDEDALRAHFDQTLRAARGCTLEFAQRDVYACDVEKGRRYIHILREEIERLWTP